MVNDLVVWLRAEWDRITGWLLIASGIGAVFVTYQRVADTPILTKQLCYLASGGLGGLLAVAIGVMFRMSADFRDEWHKLDRIELALRDDQERSEPAVLTDESHDVLDRPASAARRTLTTGVSGVAGFSLSLALLVIGYERTAGTADVNRAFGGLVIGLVGVVVASVLIGARQVAGRHRLGRRKSRLLGRWVTLATARIASATVGDPGVAVVPGGTRYHLRSCPTLAAVAATVVPRGSVDAGLRPCQICGAS